MPDFGLTNQRLAIADLNRSVEFYRRVPGLSVIRKERDPTGRVIAAELKCPRATLKLEVIGSENVGKSPRSTRRRSQTLHITTVSLNVFRRDMANHAVDGLTEVESETSGRRWFSFRDPDRNTILVEGTPEDIPFVRAVQHSHP